MKKRTYPGLFGRLGSSPVHCLSLGPAFPIRLLLLLLGDNSLVLQICKTVVKRGRLKDVQGWTREPFQAAVWELFKVRR